MCNDIIDESNKKAEKIYDLINDFNEKYDDAYSQSEYIIKMVLKLIELNEDKDNYFVCDVFIEILGLCCCGHPERYTNFYVLILMEIFIVRNMLPYNISYSEWYKENKCEDGFYDMEYGSQMVLYHLIEEKTAMLEHGSSAPGWLSYLGIIVLYYLLKSGFYYDSVGNDDEVSKKRISYISENKDRVICEIEEKYLKDIIDSVK